MRHYSPSQRSRDLAHAACAATLDEMRRRLRVHLAVLVAAAHYDDRIAARLVRKAERTASIRALFRLLASIRGA